jgi:hypothetical protein
VLTLDEGVLLVEEEVLIERVKDQQDEAGCARDTGLHEVAASRRSKRDLRLELCIEQMLIDHRAADASRPAS